MISSTALSSLRCFKVGLQLDLGSPMRSGGPTLFILAHSLWDLRWCIYYQLLKSQRLNVVKYEKLGWFQIGWACPIWIFFQILSCLVWKSPSWWVFLVPLSGWFSKLPGNGGFFPRKTKECFLKFNAWRLYFLLKGPLFRRYLSSLEVFSRNFWGFRGFGRQASPHGGYSS